MSLFKKFAGQTAIYGGGYFLMRILNYLLVSLYLLNILGGGGSFHFGIYGEIYTYIGFFILLLGLRMETIFFRFATDSKNVNKVFTTGYVMLLCVSLPFLIFVLSANAAIVNWIEDPELAYPPYAFLIIISALIVFLDVMLMLPYALFRVQERPLRFSMFKMIQIGLQIVLILVFVEIIPKLYDIDWDNDQILKIVFGSVLCSSLITLLLFVPLILRTLERPNRTLANQMIKYGYPLIGIVLSTFIISKGYTITLKYFLPDSISENLSNQGLFGGLERIAMIMGIFTTAFNYAAEPFFFQQAQKKNRNEIYVSLAYLYTLASVILIFSILVNSELILQLIPSEYDKNLYLLPYLLTSGLLIGLYFNFSVWYKVNDRTKYGALISIIGVSVYLICSIYFIPRVEEKGAVIAPIAAYISMIIANAFFSKQQKLNIPFGYGKIILLIGACLGTYYLYQYALVDMIKGHGLMVQVLLNGIVLIAFIGALYFTHRRFLSNLRNFQ